MAKQILLKELVKIDFKEDEYRFFNVEVLSVGYNDMQVIVHFGKLGNKGRETITRVKDFKEAMKIAYQKIYDKKSDHYLSKEKMKSHIESFVSREEKTQKSKRKKSKKTEQCDLCSKGIRKEIYDKINDWARGKEKGNWDYDKAFIGYKKVLCLDCQIEHDIFQKRMFSKKDKK